VARLTLHIEGMSCGHCLHAVREALEGLEGVVVESVRMGHAEVEYREAAIRPESIAAAVERAGYRARAGGPAVG